MFQHLLAEYDIDCVIVERQEVPIINEKAWAYDPQHLRKQRIQSLVIAVSHINTVAVRVIERGKIEQRQPASAAMVKNCDFTARTIAAIAFDFLNQVTQVIRAI